MLYDEFSDFENNKQSGFIDRNYLNALYTNMSYDLENIFNDDDAGSIGILLHDLNPQDNRNYINIFSENGSSNKALTKSEGPNYKIWWKDSKTGKVTHAFSKVLYKLICCTGKIKGSEKSLILNIPIYENNKMSLVEREFKIKSDRCKNLDGDDYNDDNKTKAGAKDACMDFMVKYCLFLKKYLPDSTEKGKEHYKLHCGCIMNDNIIHGKSAESISRSLLVNKSKNVACVVGDCKDRSEAYKPQFMREADCPDIIDCSIDVGGVSAEGIENSDVAVNIKQECGGDSKQVLEGTEPTKEETNQIKQQTKQDATEAVDEKKREDEIKVNNIQSEESKPKSTPKTIPEESIPKTDENISFFEMIFNWISSLFSSKENFGKSNKLITFKNLYIIFSLIIIQMFIFKDPLNIKKKLKFIHNIFMS